MTNDECVTTEGRVRAAEARGKRVGARLLMMAVYNLSSDEQGGCAGDPSIADFLRHINPTVDASYLAEKCALWRKLPAALIGSFDRVRFAKFINWCNERWGEEALARSS